MGLLKLAFLDRLNWLHCLLFFPSKYYSSYCTQQHKHKNPPEDIEKVPLIVEFFYINQSKYDVHKHRSLNQEIMIRLMKFLMCLYLLFYCHERWRDRAHSCEFGCCSFSLRDLMFSPSLFLDKWDPELNGFWTGGRKVALWVWIEIEKGEHTGNLLDSKWLQILRKGWYDLPKLHRVDINQRTGPARDPRSGLALTVVLGI